MRGGKRSVGQSGENPFLPITSAKPSNASDSLPAQPSIVGTFIRYRHEDAAGYAGRIRESLERRLGTGSDDPSVVHRAHLSPTHRPVDDADHRRIDEKAKRKIMNTRSTAIDRAIGWVSGFAA